MKHLHFFLLLLFINILLAAQQSQVIAKDETYIIKGRLTDETTKEPVGFASVVVMKTIDGQNLNIGGTTANEDGSFEIKNLSASQAILYVSFVGYQTIILPISIDANLDLGSIAIKQESIQLTEINVKGEKADMEMSLEKRVYNVSKNISAVGGTAENLLRNVPSLTIAADGTAQFRNKTTTIYINGKPTQLNLAQIPANQIESVELISNPSAKYDASASSGIVNLVLRKNRKPGYNGSASVGIGNNSRYDGMINADVNIGKWNISILYNVNATQNPLNGYVNRTNFYDTGVAKSYFNQNTNINLSNVFQNGRVSMEYTASKRNTLAWSFNYISGMYNSKTNQPYTNADSLHNLINYGQRNTTPSNILSTIGVELDWKHSFSQKGRSLSFTSGYNVNKVSNAANWFTSVLNPDGSNQINSPELDKITGITTGNQLITQLDYTHPINDSSKLETGLRSYTYIRDQQYFFNQWQPASNQYALLQNYSQNARITESVNAIYALYTWKMKNNVSVQAGLRFEQSVLNGVSRFDPPITFGYNYPKADLDHLVKAFFPSFAISKKLSETAEIGLNLTRKIERPGWRQVFIGIQSSDRQNISIGNPALQPEFVNTAELNYNKTWDKTNWLATAYFIYEDNTIKPIVQPSATDPSVLITTFTNVKADVRSGIDNTLSFTLFKNLNMVANLNLFNIILQTDTYSKSLWTENAKINMTYNFPLNVSAQLINSYNGEFPQLQGYRKAIYAADFAIKKSFWNNTASVVFTINDLFNSRKQYMIYDQPTAYQETMSRREVRFYKLTLQLPLGKPSEFSAKKKTKKNDQQIIDVGN